MTLEDIQDGILEQLHAGEPVDRAAALAEHPGHTEALGAFFDLLDVIEAEPGMNWAVPATLGDFRIVREIGRGGMGVVYEAEQASLKRRVALKVLPPSLRTDSRLVARFRREAEAAGRLRHPGIVPVYSVGEVAGTPFFAMELVDGCSLDATIEALRAGGVADGVPEGEEPRRMWAVETIARVADALAYAHAESILHRDVKPGNVILEADGTPRLTDFGLAQDLRAPGLTRAGEVFGSPKYMSPEQAVRRDAPLDERTDVYSLAVTLYELLTLRLPYDATTAAQLLTALATGQLIAPRVADRDMPEPLAAVLTRALRKDPRDRYRTASDFAADLRAAVAGGEISPEAVSLPRKRRWTRSRIALAAAAGVLIGIVGGFALHTRGSERELVADLGVDRSLTFEELGRLARGEEPDGERLMRAAFRFDETMRSVVSRADMGNYRCEVEHVMAHRGRLDDRVVILAAWEVSVNRGEWKPLADAWMSVGPAPGASAGTATVSTNSIACAPQLSDALGDDLTADSLVIRHRATLHVAAAPTEWVDRRTTPLSGGTQLTWTGDEHTLLVYDRYPADYPAVVTGPEVDEPMEQALRPESVHFVKVDAQGATRTLHLMLFRRNSRPPLNGAFEVEVATLDGRVVGTGMQSYNRVDAPGEGVVSVEATSWGSLLVDLADAPSEEEARFLLDLESGRIAQLRLVFRPSRAQALDQPEFDRYWGGTIDVEVPVEPWDPSLPSR